MKPLKARDLIVGLAASLFLLLAAPGWCGEKQKPAAGAKLSVPAEFEKEYAAALQITDIPKRADALSKIGIEWSKKDPIAALIWGDYLDTEGTIIPHRKTQEYRWVWLRVVHAIGQDKEGAKVLGEYLISPQCTINMPWHKLIKFNFSWVLTDSAACTACCLKAPASMRFQAFESAGQMWSLNDPAAAVAWMLSLEDPKDRYSAIVGVATWVTGDISDVTKWIKKLKPGEAKFAIKIIAGRLKGKGDRAARHWSPSAEEWVDSFSLSDADKEYVWHGPAINVMQSDIYKK